MAKKKRAKKVTGRNFRGHKGDVKPTSKKSRSTHGKTAAEKAKYNEYLRKKRALIRETWGKK